MKVRDPEPGLDLWEANPSYRGRVESPMGWSIEVHIASGVDSRTSFVLGSRRVRDRLPLQAGKERVAAPLSRRGPRGAASGPPSMEKRLKSKAQGVGVGIAVPTV